LPARLEALRGPSSDPHLDTGGRVNGPVHASPARGASRSFSNRG